MNYYDIISNNTQHVRDMRINENHEGIQVFIQQFGEEQYNLYLTKGILEDNKRAIHNQFLAEMAVKESAKTDVLKDASEVVLRGLEIQMESLESLIEQATTQLIDRIGPIGVARESIFATGLGGQPRELQF